MVTRTVLVTGGLGAIGSYVCRALIRADYRPVVYDISPSTAMISDVMSQCAIEVGSASELPRVLEVMSRHQPIAVIHLAGLLGASVENQAWSSIQSNLIGTVAVFEAARQRGIQRIAFASSRQIYGPVADSHRHPAYDPVPEDHAHLPLKLYGKIKRSSEDIAGHYAHQFGMEIVALRFASTFGPGKLGTQPGKISRVPEIIEAAIANRPLRVARGGDQCDGLCYHGDCAQAFLLAIEATLRPGSVCACNIASGELLSLGDMVNVLRSLYPRWDAEIGGGLDYDDTGSGYYFQLAIDKARAELGYEPRFPFRAAVMDYAETKARLAI